MPVCKHSGNTPLGHKRRVLAHALVSPSGLCFLPGSGRRRSESSLYCCFCSPPLLETFLVLEGKKDRTPSLPLPPPLPALEDSLDSSLLAVPALGFPGKGYTTNLLGSSPDQTLLTVPHCSQDPS